MFDLMPSAISSRVGFGLFLIIAIPLITIPGVQKPHWTAPTLPKAYTKASCSSWLSPSIVIISLPCNFDNFWVQAGYLLLSTIMVQVPHAP